MSERVTVKDLAGTDPRFGYLPLIDDDAEALRHLVTRAAGQTVAANERLPRTRLPEHPGLAPDGVALATIRHPVERFVYMYGRSAFVPGTHRQEKLVDLLREGPGYHLGAQITQKQHLENIDVLLDWLTAARETGTHRRLVRRWRAQSRPLEQIDPAKCLVIPQEIFAPAVKLFISENIPDLADLLGPMPDPDPLIISLSALSARQIARIEALYRRDLARWTAARDSWAARDFGAMSEPRPLSQPRPAKAPETMRALGGGGLPIHAIVVPKAGCTFVRNLMYRLVHQRLYHDPLDIANAPDLPREDVGRAQLQSEPGFILVRDPVRRFLSLYFDKVIGTGPHAFPFLAETLAKDKRFTRDPKTPEGHRANCGALANLIAQQMARSGRETVNPHWRPQSVRARPAIDFGFQPLDLSQARAELVRLYAATLPELGTVIDNLPPMNESEKPVEPDVLATPDLTARIHALYPDDLALYNETRESARQRAGAV